jgi:hypothetical protein
MIYSQQNRASGSPHKLLHYLWSARSLCCLLESNNHRFLDKNFNKFRSLDSCYVIIYYIDV